MKRLILMRHAKSDWSAGLEDHARPLNARGVRSAAAMGDWLRRMEYLPDQVLCSTAKRTRETLDCLNTDAPAQFERALYHASADAMLSVLRQAGGEAVLMLGHNPGIGDFANALMSEAPPHPRFADYPTCATLIADFDITTWKDLRFGTGKPRDFAVPREVMAE